MLKIIYFIIALIFIAFGLVLGAFNPHQVNIDLVFLQTNIPLSLLLSISFLLGGFISAIYFGSIVFKLSWRLKKQLKENTKQANKTIELNTQLIELKSLSSNQNSIKN